MRASALDLATLSGLAYGAVGERPTMLTWRLKRDNRGLVGVALMMLLNEHLEEYSPDMLFIEAPLTVAVMNMIGTTHETSILLPGLVMIAETVAASHGIPSQLLERQKTLGHFVGKARFPKQKDVNAAKEACFQRCKQLRWPAIDYEQSDAAALWDYGLALTRSREWMQASNNRPSTGL